MTCANCGSPAVELVDQSGGTSEGPFREEYQSAECGAVGHVRGEAGEPATTWRRTGMVFDR
jgi:hypothetical protein